MSVTYDHSGPWTVEDVLALQKDPRGNRYELLDGSLLLSPAPEGRHQRASYKLHRLLDDAARAAGAQVEILESINITMPSGLLVPDIAVVDAAAAAEDPVSIDADAVLLVVELVSLGNQRMDRLFKPGLYAEAHIPSYWRLEFEPAPSLVVSELYGARYREVVTAPTGVSSRIRLPFPIEIDPGTLHGRRQESRASDPTC
jgi:Uma2 family endonuclease